MTTVTLAFRRWLEAERTVRDATDQLLYLIHDGSAMQIAGQQAVLRQLRHESSELLYDYLFLLDRERDQLWHFRLPSSSAAVPGLPAQTPPA